MENKITILEEEATKFKRKIFCHKEILSLWKKCELKYGTVKYDYFIFHNNKRFVNDKNIDKYNFIQIHHLFGPFFDIYGKEYDDFFHKKEVLVYCDLLEHFLFHIYSYDIIFDIYGKIKSFKIGFISDLNAMLEIDKDIELENCCYNQKEYKKAIIEYAKRIKKYNCFPIKSTFWYDRFLEYKCGKEYIHSEEAEKLFGKEIKEIFFS